MKNSEYKKGLMGLGLLILFVLVAIAGILESEYFEFIWFGVVGFFIVLWLIQGVKRISASFHTLMETIRNMPKQREIRKKWEHILKQHPQAFQGYKVIVKLNKTGLITGLIGMAPLCLWGFFGVPIPAFVIIVGIVFMIVMQVIIFRLFAKYKDIINIYYNLKSKHRDIFPKTKDSIRIREFSSSKNSLSSSRSSKTKFGGGKFGGGESKGRW